MGVNNGIEVKSQICPPSKSVSGVVILLGLILGFRAEPSNSGEASADKGAGYQSKLINCEPAKAAAL